MKLFKLVFLTSWFFFSLVPSSYSGGSSASGSEFSTDTLHCTKACRVASAQYQQACSSSYYNPDLDTFKNVGYLITCLSSVRVRVNACKIECHEMSNSN